MKDLIDDRNEKERIRRSIIKHWNVNYIPDHGTSGIDDQSQQVLNRLQGEAEEDQARMQGEINDAMREAKMREDMYNATTGSYSGTYGNTDINDITKGQIDKILREKSDAIRNIVEKKKE